MFTGFFALVVDNVDDRSSRIIEEDQGSLCKEENPTKWSCLGLVVKFFVGMGNLKNKCKQVPYCPLELEKEPCLEFFC